MHKRITLDNGIRVVTENISHFRSVSIGVWVGIGSAFENLNNNGVSHFIEHILFKGTEKRTAKDIAEEVDGIGGQINAFTAKEYTCFYIKTLDEHIEKGLDILSDMLINSVFDNSEIEKEKGIIKEEISMYEDSPEDLVHDLMYATCFKKHPLGLPILGNNESIENMTRDKLLTFFDTYYARDNVVISVAGSFDEKKLPHILNKYFGDWKRTSHTKNNLVKPKVAKNSLYREKDIEQVHICVAFKGLSLDNEKKYALIALNSILGGGMSSRLFQTVREESGLVYSIFSYPTFYSKTGLLSIYAGMKPCHITEVMNLVSREIKNLREGKLSKGEVDKVKEQLKGNYVLGLESTSSRMSAIGKSELMLGKIFTPDDIIKKIDDVDLSAVMDMAERIFNTENICVTVVGKLLRGLNLEDITIYQ